MLWWREESHADVVAWCLSDEVYPSAEMERQFIQLSSAKSSLEKLRPAIRSIVGSVGLKKEVERVLAKLSPERWNQDIPHDVALEYYGDLLFKTGLMDYKGGEKQMMLLRGFMNDFADMPLWAVEMGYRKWRDDTPAGRRLTAPDLWKCAQSERNKINNIRLNYEVAERILGFASKTTPNLRS